jgi:hypothetical protein
MHWHLLFERITVDVINDRLLKRFVVVRDPRNICRISVTVFQIGNEPVSKTRITSDALMCPSRSFPPRVEPRFAQCDAGKLRYDPILSKIPHPSASASLTKRGTFRGSFPAYDVIIRGFFAFPRASAIICASCH